MVQALTLLTNEHRLIESVLGALEELARRARRGDRIDRRVVGQFATFLREYADRVHHGKEENLLFIAMMAKGFASDSGPIAVMMAEHEQGRSHARMIWQLGQETGEWTQEDTRALDEHATAFSSLLRQHIWKEDQVLYPMASRALTAEEMEGMAREFEAFEEREGNPSLIELGKSLVHAHAGQTASMPSNGCCCCDNG